MIEKSTLVEAIDLPNNSHKSKDIDDARTTKVIKGSVVIKKKRFGRIREAFTGDDSVTVSSYLLYDIFIPALKNTLFEMISGGSEMFLFGSRRNDRIRRDRNTSYISYNKQDRYRSRGRIEDDRPLPRETRNDPNNIVLSDRIDAEEVLNGLVDLVDSYGSARVTDLYDLIGATAQYTDDKYGWTNLGSAKVDRVRDGYHIDLPRPKPLD